MATTKLSHSVTARVIDNKAISLSTNWTHTTIKLLGTTVPSSIKPVSEYGSGVQQLTLYLEQGVEGIIAVVVSKSERVGKGWSHESVPAFLRISWKEKDGQKYPFIDLDEPWISADRIGQVTESTIEVAIKGKHFCTYNHGAWKHNEGKDLPGYVPDGNLLCKYLWGSASAGDVLHVAVQRKLEPLAVKRVEQMTNEIRVLQHEVRRLTQKVQSLETDNAFLEEHRETAVEWSNTLLGNLVSMQDLRNLLKRIPRWLRPKSANEFIAAMDAAKV